MPAALPLRLRIRHSKKQTQWLSALFAVLLPLLPAAAPVQALEPNELHKSVLVYLGPSVNRAQFAAAMGELGAVVAHEYRLIPSVVNLRNVSEESFHALADLPGVIGVEQDRIVRINLVDSTLRIRGRQQQLADAGLAATGAGARICICDTGINPTHTMYEGRIDVDAGYDFVNNDNDPSDDNGHGSHIAGIAAGRADLLVNFFGGSGLEPLQGVAPEATLIAVKVLGANGSGALSDVIAGIDHCASPDLPGGPADVINLSLSDATAHMIACDSDPLAMAANNAVANGVVVVASSGNNGYGNALPSPACGSDVIAVGATWDDPFPNADFPPLDSFTFCIQRNAFGMCVAECTDDLPITDSVACYSNHSAMIDVTAPGSYIWSAVHDSRGLIEGKHGTSQAAAHVSGLAALIIAQTPSLTPATVRQLIRDGGLDFGPPGFDPAYGFGRIDVINSLLLISGCTTDPECSDGKFCNGVEFCDAGTCSSGAYPCGALLCREVDDQCVDCLADADCDDGVACNGPETCDAAGNCQANTSPDCNGNGVVDACDIVDETSEDCNVNNIPDECEPDCNGNGVPDICDLVDGSSIDCNSNVVPDECDLSSGFSQDCNLDGIPDECQSDCNGNDIPDDCDLATGDSADCNGNATPDECDIASGTSQDCDSDGTPDECQEDCNGNGQPDTCDLSFGTSEDCNDNAVPDECDISSETSPDCNANATPDECDIAAGASDDCNANLIPDECDVDGGSSVDCNLDGVPDECQPDCNANNVPDDCDLATGSSLDCNENLAPDECDIASGTSQDCDADGTPDECQEDCNVNGQPDTCDITSGASQDCNDNSVPDECDVDGGSSVDCNLDGVPDECQPDCNANNVPDDCDLATGSSLDCNENLMPDECDIASGTSQDCDSDGMPDECQEDCNGNGQPDTCDLFFGTSEDCNDNAVPDECDITSGTSPDCNANAAPDECDIATGASDDCNANLIPDECEPDCNADGRPDDCEAPTVVASGCRYLTVTPRPACSDAPIALVLRAPAWLCLTKFVNAAGNLVDTPVFQTPMEWGQVHVTGVSVIPREVYHVHATSGLAESEAATARTWRWGDVNNNGIANLVDAQLALFAFHGDLSQSSLQSTDMVPCATNRAVNLDDVLAVVAAFGAQSYEMVCPLPCE